MTRGRPGALGAMPRPWASREQIDLTGPNARWRDHSRGPVGQRGRQGDRPAPPAQWRGQVSPRRSGRRARRPRGRRRGRTAEAARPRRTT